MKSTSIKNLLLLHVNILIFSFTGILSKLMAASIGRNGAFYYGNIIFFILMLINCGVYAIFWQQSLKHFDVNVAYSHRSAYNIWSLIWAYVVFREKITIQNILGTLLIIVGILIIQGEKGADTTGM